MSVTQTQRLYLVLGDSIHLKAKVGGGRQRSRDRADSNSHGGLLFKSCSNKQEAKGGGGMGWADRGFELCMSEVD